VNKQFQKTIPMMLALKDYYHTLQEQNLKNETPEPLKKEDVRQLVVIVFDVLNDWEETDEAAKHMGAISVGWEVRLVCFFFVCIIWVAARIFG
jgi:hypothetical protein